MKTNQTALTAIHLDSVTGSIPVRNLFSVAQLVEHILILSVPCLKTPSAICYLFMKSIKKCVSCFL